MQRDTEIKQKFFFLLFIYSGRKKQLTSIVDKVDTKKERLATLSLAFLNDHATLTITEVNDSFLSVLNAIESPTFILMTSSKRSFNE